MDEVAGWTLHRSKLTNKLRNVGYPLPSLNRTESSRWNLCAFPRAFPSRHRPIGQYPTPTAGTWRVAGGRPLTPRNDFGFDFFRGGPSFAVFAKGGSLRSVYLS